MSSSNGWITYDAIAVVVAGVDGQDERIGHRFEIQHFAVLQVDVDFARRCIDRELIGPFQCVGREQISHSTEIAYNQQKCSFLYSTTTIDLLPIQVFQI